MHTEINIWDEFRLLIACILCSAVISIVPANHPDSKVICQSIRDMAKKLMEQIRW